MRIVFASDLHFGTLWGRRYGQKLVSRINAEDPDLVIFGGDLVDRSLSFVMREGSYGCLAQPPRSYGPIFRHGQS